LRRDIYDPDPSLRVKPANEISLLICGVLDLDMGCSAAPEGGDKTPIVGAVSGENEPAPGAVVPILAVFGREDTTKKPLSAAINPDGQFRPWIADLMRNYAKSFDALGAEGERHIRP